MTKFRIIPVLDLKNGVVVRAIAGRRDRYRPIVSGLTTSCQPTQVARAFRDHLGLTEMYLADLGAIAGAEPALAVYAELRNLGCQLWIDAGVREAADAERLTTSAVERLVIGLETIQGPEMVAQLCLDFDAGRLMFSLDLNSGTPLGKVAVWDRPDAWSIATQAIALGIRRMIVLDLCRVGLNIGTGTEDLCARLVRAFPHVEIVAGGGVRDVDDLHRLRDCGVTAVLVASALHDGRIDADAIAAL